MLLSHVVCGCASGLAFDRLCSTCLEDKQLLLRHHHTLVSKQMLTVAVLLSTIWHHEAQAVAYPYWLVLTCLSMLHVLYAPC